ncbi:MAG TPA: hypothetical protein P5142_07160, partial [Spirochaetia bacterium]|nr:hypothetical protein [Spirochaetia bacterium]
DLTNSASERFVPEFFAGLAAAANRMLSVLRGLAVDRERMAANLRLTGGAVLAEPAYILLAESGRADAHEMLRRITLAAEADRLALHEAIERDGEAWEAVRGRLAELGIRDPEDFFRRPELYRGRAAERALAIGEKYRAVAATLAARGEGNAEGLERGGRAR